MRDAELIGALVIGKQVDPFDWERLTRSATEERMAPLLYWKLREDTRVPERAKSALREELYRSEASNLALYRALDSLLEAGAQAGLEAPVILKGGALATSAYDEVGLRPMSDIDLLVPATAVSAWIDVAEELSFRRLSPELARGLTEAVSYQVALEGGPTGDAFVELHFGLIGGASDWRAPDVDWFFERTEPWTGIPSLASSGELRARQLEPTAHLLYLAAHALLQHGSARARVIWLYDVHLLLTRFTARIRWEELAEKAKELRWSAALAAALARSNELFGTVVPENLIEALERDADSRSRRMVERRADRTQSRAELVLSDLLAVRGWTRMRWILAILFPRPEYMRWRYPRAGRLWPFGYPYRWLRVLGEGVRALGARALS